ncbi:Uncharacterised protein [Legionella busanensis]|uniref:Uncharacterized protein n=1 Tax=Legionella busanensis TaxID=190655 RepID=A0A378KBU6_9GAMM|nr:Uncharacterised protein [Legionella busanensis]
MNKGTVETNLFVLTRLSSPYTSYDGDKAQADLPFII